MQRKVESKKINSKIKEINRENVGLKQKDKQDLEQYDQKNEQFLENLKKFMIKLPNPSDKQQTFSQYKQLPRKIIEKKRKIYIVPLGFTDKNFMEILQQFASAFFSLMEIEVCQQEDFDQWKITKRMNDGVKQYHAGEILQKLKSLKPSNCHAIIAVTLQDLYPRDSWNYVFGLAQADHGVGVFSFARYSETFWDPEALPDPQLIIFRSCKVMCHELGHLFGIRHCQTYYCLMNQSEDDTQSSQKPFQMCLECEKKIQHCLGYEMRQRYINLMNISEKLSGPYFHKEFLIYKKILNSLNKLENNDDVQNKPDNHNMQRNNKEIEIKQNNFNQEEKLEKLEKPEQAKLN